MIGRADIEGSKSNVAMNAWLPQASSELPGPAVNPCGNFSGTSSLKFRGTKGSIGHTFMVCIHTENQNQGDFCPFALLEISVLHESPLGHLRYGLTDVPPQPNSPPDNVFNPDRPTKDLNARSWAVRPSSASSNKVVVFHWRRSSHLFYTPYVFSQCQTRVKLNQQLSTEPAGCAQPAGCDLRCERLSQATGFRQPLARSLSH
ncbi:hypothetical protein BU26DRAFT_443551 [Trematosphaeria pertusa]|uniref:Senescence-associated protein n=1 Tax=Trematosphaeria pertusa TaxID=390896 RepID=A0A6A6HQU6_9PLEO|nr:hypothetical protein BU26DRAFT_443551 [Trematosphaeria pertusa]